MKYFFKLLRCLLIIGVCHNTAADVITKDFRQLSFAEAVKQTEYLLSWSAANLNYSQYRIRYIGADNAASTSCSAGAYQETSIYKAHEFIDVANTLPLGEVRIEISASDASGVGKEWLVLVNREVDSLPTGSVTFKDFSNLNFSTASDNLIDGVMGWYQDNRSVDHYTLTYLDPVSGTSQTVTGITNTDFRSTLDQLSAGSYEFEVSVFFTDGKQADRYVALNKLPGDVAPTTVSLQLSWSLPTQREDGTTLDVQDISGYEIYMSRIDSANTVTDQVMVVSGANQTSLMLPDLSTGQYHLAISAIDTAGLKSQLSDVVSYTVN